MECQIKKCHILWPFLLSIIAITCIALFYVYKTGKDRHETVKIWNGEDLPFSAEQLKEDNCISVCDTKECLLFAKSMLSNLKLEFDPCEDSHAFACGKYIEKYGSERGNSFQDAEFAMYKNINNILRSMKSDPESASGKMKAVYDSCIDYGSSEIRTLETASKFLEDIGIPNWPNLERDFNLDLPTVIGNLEARGEIMFLTFIVSMYIDPRVKNKTNATVLIDIRYFDKLLMPPEKKAIKHILNFFDVDSEQMEEIWNDYNVVRDSILKLLNESCRNLDFDCNSFGYIEWFEFVPYEENCTSIGITCPDDNWAHICNIFSVFLNATHLHDRINSDFLKIDSGDDHFMKNIIPMLSEFSNRTVANFLALEFFMNHLEELNLYFRITKKTYFSRKRCDFLEKEVPMDRLRFCTDWIAKNMLLAVEHEFVKNHIPKSELKQLMSFFEISKSELMDVVGQQLWIPEDDKGSLSTVIRYIAINLRMLEENYIQSFDQLYENYTAEFYREFHPISNNFFHNVLELRRTASDMHLILLPKHGSYYKYLSKQFEAQAENFGNYITLKYGILFPPFHIKDISRFFNMVMFLTVIGHEIGHSIDEYFQYNENASTIEFQEKRDCLIQQYSQFKFETSDENLNGSRYIGESFADAIYIEMVDRLIKRNFSDQVVPRLPGVPFSPLQLLYIAMTQQWCMKTDEKEQIFFKVKDNHAPQNKRTIGTMQNSRGYSEAFQCPEGSYMNPAKKCIIMN